MLNSESFREEFGIEHEYLCFVLFHVVGRYGDLVLFDGVRYKGLAVEPDNLVDNVLSFRCQFVTLI